MLERQQVFQSTPIAIHDCGFTGLESLQCFSRSIQIAESNIKVMNKLSKVKFSEKSPNLIKIFKRSSLTSRSMN